MTVCSLRLRTSATARPSTSPVLLHNGKRGTRSPRRIGRVWAALFDLSMQRSQSGRRGASSKAAGVGGLQSLKLGIRGGKKARCGCPTTLRVLCALCSSALKPYSKHPDETTRGRKSSVLPALRELRVPLLPWCGQHCLYPKRPTALRAIRRRALGREERPHRHAAAAGLGEFLLGLLEVAAEQEEEASQAVVLGVELAA
jgi:hypothetical protein